jgi:hypothetical protein
VDRSLPVVMQCMMVGCSYRTAEVYTKAAVEAATSKSGTAASHLCSQIEVATTFFALGLHRIDGGLKDATLYPTGQE